MLIFIIDLAIFNKENLLQTLHCISSLKTRIICFQKYFIWLFYLHVVLRDFNSKKSFCVE